MTNRFVKALAAVALLSGAAACTGPDGDMASVDALQMANQYFAANPAAEQFSIANNGERGFYINRDGSMTYKTLNAPMVVRGQYWELDGNQFCMGKVGAFSGACMELFRDTATGSHTLYFSFGSDQVFSSGKSYSTPLDQS